MLLLESTKLEFHPQSNTESGYTIPLMETEINRSKNEVSGSNDATERFVITFVVTDITITRS